MASSRGRMSKASWRDGAESRRHYIDIAILLPDLRCGGVEKLSLDLSREFTARGFSVGLVLRRARGELLPAVGRHVTIHDLKAERVRDAFVPFVRFLQKWQPRSVLAAMWPLSSLAICARATARVDARVVVSEHTNLLLSRSGRSAMSRLTLRTTLGLSHRFADGVVAVSEGLAQQLSALGNIQRGCITVIYNPITPLPPTGQINDGLVERWLSGSPRIIAVGSLKEPKDYPLLLRSFARVRQFKRAHLLILGEGNERTSIQPQLEALNLRESVSMPGFVPNPHDYIRMADLFVLCSRYEGFGNVIVEALASGTPVVSTDCPFGPREILESGRYGILVPTGDEEALASAMLAATDVAHDRDALIRRAEYFSVSRAADRYLELLLPCEAVASGVRN